MGTGATRGRPPIAGAVPTQGNRAGETGPPASVSFSGLGLSEFYCNGARVGDRVLSPAMMQYPRRLPYVTLDLSNHLKQGINALGVVLGNGRFYAPRSEVYAAMPTYGSPMLRLLLTVEHTDGTTTEVVSDTSWQLTDSGPIVANNEYDGEEYDARRELGDWAFVGYDDTEWHRVEKMEPPAARLSSEAIEPIRVTQTVKPVNLTNRSPESTSSTWGKTLSAGADYVLMGQRVHASDFAMLRRCRVMRHSALANLRTAKATDIYVLAGKGPKRGSRGSLIMGFATLRSQAIQDVRRSIRLQDALFTTT